MNQTLKTLRQTNRISQKEIAKILGISQSAYSQIEKGSVSISVEHLRTLCETYAVSMDWLVMGVGAKRLSKNRQNGIPLVNINAVAGYIKNLKNEEYISELEYFTLPGFEEGSYRIFEVSGNSMKPSILPNDYLVCSEIEDLGQVLEGSICVLVEKERISVKRISFQDGNGEMLTLNSDNPKFIPHSIHQKDLLEMWLVNSKITNSLSSNSTEQETRIKRLEDEFSDVKSHLNQLLQNFRV